MKKHYLMIKTHNITGMKYLCKKTSDKINLCYNYTGSGLFWKRHLKKYGVDFSTNIIAICDTIEELRENAIYWSEYYDVVNSSEWANIVQENGSNINDRTFEQMQLNRQITLKKMQADPSYQATRKRVGRETSIRQLGVKVKDRVSRKNWVDSRTGKKWVDIYGHNYIHPQAKPFAITLNDGEARWVFNCESEVKQIGLCAHPTLGKMKKHGFIYIKTTSKRSRHSFRKGDKLSFEYIN